MTPVMTKPDFPQPEHRTEGIHVASMLAPRNITEGERSEQIVTFGKPSNMMQKPMFIDDAEESMKYHQNRQFSSRDDEEVKQFGHNQFKEELKEEVEEDGTSIRPQVNM